MEKFLVRNQAPNSPAGKRKKGEGQKSPDEWRTAKKFVTHQTRTNKDTKYIETPVDNRFEGLPVEDDEPSSEPFKNATKKQTGHAPPIIIELQNNFTLQTIRDLVLKYNKNFHLQFRGRKLVRVQCYSAKDHQELKDGLLHENIPFHTFTRKDERNPKAVVKGLPKFLQEHIQTELELLGFSDASVTELKTLNPTDCPPLLVHLPCGTNMARFKQIRYLFNCVVTVEKYKPNRRPGTQCFRCQGFGHSSKNCNRSARCLKCAQDHPTWECTKKDRTEPARCCNCQKEHPANYSKCDERVKYLERIESKRISLRTTKPNREAQTSQKTWANVVSTSNTKSQHVKEANRASVYPDIPRPQKFPINSQQTTNTPSIARRPVKTTPTAGVSDGTTGHDLETAEMLEILSALQSVKTEFRKCETFLDKVMLILSHLGHYV